MRFFVDPGTTRLTLEDYGITLTVRTRLNVGQTRARLDRVYHTTNQNEVVVDTMEIGRATILAYLVDWTVVDNEGALMAIRGLDVAALEVVLDQLEGDVFHAIRDAIDAHERRQTDAREAEKKTPALTIASPGISHWPVAADGGTSG